jgi:hypothetical protein
MLPEERSSNCETVLAFMMVPLLVMKGTRKLSLKVVTKYRNKKT